MNREPSKNFANMLHDLNFHDSTIEEIALGRNQSSWCGINCRITYYNWEGNSEITEYWTRKTLRLRVAHVLSFQVYGPDLRSDPLEIDAAFYDEDLDVLFKKEKDIKRSEPKYRSYFFDDSENYLSLRFETHCGQNQYLGYAGFIKLVGSGASLEWGESFQAPKIHIPIRQ